MLLSLIKTYSYIRRPRKTYVLEFSGLSDINEKGKMRNVTRSLMSARVEKGK